MVTGNWSLHNNAWLSNISGYLINAYRAEPGISNFLARVYLKLCCTEMIVQVYKS